jgi:uncharacterized protein YfdQ (DUF2303 family)
MFDASAVQALSKAEAVTATAAAISGAIEIGRAVAAVPNDFEVKDFETYLPTRRRPRGTMATSVLADFAAYAGANAAPGASVFIDKDRMRATAVLNLGTTDQPGHADNLATITLEKSAAFAALLSIANGQPRKQTDVAEFLEDWAPFIACRNEADVIPTGHAAAAIRNITIEAAKKVTSSEQQLGAARSAFESVQASSGVNLPTQIEFRCEPPYFGLSSRTLGLRLSILTTDKPMVVLRVVKLEEHQEGMAAEFAQLTRDAVGAGMPVAIGTYQRA